MNISVKNNIPEFLPQEYEALYKSMQTYTIALPRVRLHKNVFVSHEGLCLKNLRLLPKSSFNIRTKYDVSFGKSYHRLVFEQFIVSKYRKSLEYIKLEDKKYTLIHTKWFNYSFWLTSSLIRLFYACKEEEEVTVIYPESWKNIPYINESLKLFPNIKKEIIPSGVHLIVKSLVLPEVREFTAGFAPSQVKEFRDYVKERIKTQNIKIELSGKTYITRKKAKYRKFANEDFVIKTLTKQNYTIIDFEDYSFFEQVYIMMKTHSLISIHGAGLSNILFMPEGAKVFELMHHYTSKDDYRFVFWKLAESVGLKYHIQFCQTEGENPNPLYHDLRIDELLFSENIEKFHSL